MEGQGFCCPLPFAYFPHGKPIQVMAEDCGHEHLARTQIGCIDLPGEPWNKAILYLSC